MISTLKKHSLPFLAVTGVVAGITTAAVSPIPSISDTFAVNGEIIKSVDLNNLAVAINILDARTDGDMPVDADDLVDLEYLSAVPAPAGNGDVTNKEYVDNAVSAAGDWQKGVICPDGEIFQGYNADATAKCETPESLGIASTGGSSSAPDVTGLTGFGDITQFTLDGRSFVYIEDEEGDCSSLGSGWYEGKEFISSYDISNFIPMNVVNSEITRPYLCRGGNHYYYNDGKVQSLTNSKCSNSIDDAGFIKLCEYVDQ